VSHRPARALLWGSSTEQLIESVDAVEQHRGFAPPIFIDVRVHRSVQAKGFANDSFEKGQAEVKVAVAPARCKKSGWCLPIVQDDEGYQLPATKRAIAAWRHDNGYKSRFSS
jgi:hypothetical protein